VTPPKPDPAPTPPSAHRDLRKLAIVPAYNEENSVGRVVAELGEHVPEFDVVVVDDGSTDSTAATALEAGATVIQHPFNLGIGGAVQSGFKYARRHGYDIAVQVDGDGQHDPAQIHKLLRYLRMNGEADMICGTRFRGPAGYRVPLARRVGRRILSLALRPIIGQEITDPTSGFRMTNRRGIELFARSYPTDYPEVEAILMAHAHRLHMHEIGVEMRERAHGRSSIRPSHSAYYMARVLLAMLVGLFRRRPVVEPGGDAAVSAQRVI
jgi:glycosyltransferase involved in cell wall biosynthesis